MALARNSSHVCGFFRLIWELTITCITCRPVDHRLAQADVACQSAPMDPPCSRDTKSVTSVVQGFHEEVQPMRWWASWCSLDIPQNPIGDGSRPAGVCEAHYVADPPNFRQLGPRDSVSDHRTSAKHGNSGGLSLA
ncbi:unnamed protein product [Heligmosomoides polygyrus]|uniref:Secreted protein n=1 Tax=Heligmosomoides polygyrus TaxID=6339 RepID=A0A183GKI1_HELPZ|nr:unnamed protein product [Heligmosomoides polygyrus]